MKFNKIILVTLLLTGLPYLVHAGDTGYEVELIVFEYSQSRQLESEDWSYNDMLNNVKDIAVTKNEYHDSEFMILDWQNAELSDSLKKIESNSNYNVLVKKRWKQTGLDRENAYTIDITSLIEPSSDTNQEENNKKQNTIIVKNDELTTKNMTVSDDLNIMKSNYIQGRVKLIMSRYLHFEVNLNYFQLQTDLPESGYKSYPIVSERRMRSREIHYIDHPMIGVIVHAVPYKIKPPKIINGAKGTLPKKSN